MLRRLAGSLGLSYAQHSATNPLDRFAWEISGKHDGREVKLARVPQSFMGREMPWGGAATIAASCAVPERLSVSIRRRWDEPGGPGEPIPVPGLENLVACGAGGALDLGRLGRLAVMDVLTMEGPVQAGIEIKEGRVRLYYDLGSPVLNFHPPFVERALRATVELADMIQSGRATKRPAE